MIKKGSKWQYKDGGVYEVVDYGKQTSPNGTYADYVVWYCKVGETAKAYPRLKSHFLDSFKPYEPIKQEYIVTISKDGKWKGWTAFATETSKLKYPMMYKITVEYLSFPFPKSLGSSHLEV